MLKDLDYITPEQKAVISNPNTHLPELLIAAPLFTIRLGLTMAICMMTAPFSILIMSIFGSDRVINFLMGANKK